MLTVHQVLPAAALVLRPLLDLLPCLVSFLHRTQRIAALSGVLEQYTSTHFFCSPGAKRSGIYARTVKCCVSRVKFWSHRTLRDPKQSA